MAERKNKNITNTDSVTTQDDKKTTTQNGAGDVSLTTPQSDALVEQIKKRPLTGRGGTQNFPNAQVNESPDDARRILSEVVAWTKMPKVQSDEECEERIEYFFEKCAQNGERPTVEKMCLALGTYRDQVWDWENGRGCSAARRDVIKRAKAVLAAYDAGLAITGKINPVPYIFRAKNFYGMKDEQEVVLTPNNPLGGAQDENEIAKKYAALPED